MKRLLVRVFKIILKIILAFILFFLVVYGIIRIKQTYKIAEENRNNWSIEIWAYSRPTIKGFEIVTITARNGNSTERYELWVYNYDRKLRDEQVQIVWDEENDGALIYFNGDENGMETILILFEPNLCVQEARKLYGTEKEFLPLIENHEIRADF